MDHQHLIIILILYSCSIVISMSMLIQYKQLNSMTKTENETEVTMKNVQKVNNENSENDQFSNNETFVDNQKLINNSINSESLDGSSISNLNKSEATEDIALSTEFSTHNYNTEDSSKFAGLTASSSTIAYKQSTTSKEKSISYIQKTSDKTKTKSAFNLTTSSLILPSSVQLAENYSKIKSVGSKDRTTDRTLLPNRSTTQRNYHSIFNFPISIGIIYQESGPVLKSNKEISKNLSLMSQKSKQSPLTTTKLPTLSSETANPKILLKSKTNEFTTENKDPSKFEIVLKNPLKALKKSIDTKRKTQIKKMTTQSSSSSIKMTTIPAPWKARFGNYNETSFDKVCNLEKDEGWGLDRFSMWYFNTKTGKCEWFNYLGSGGNGNRFYYRANCESSCIEKVNNLCERPDIVNCIETWLQCNMMPDSECQQNALMDKLDFQLVCSPKQPICVNLPREIRKSPVYLTHRSLIPSDCKLPKDPGYCKTDSDNKLVYHYSEKLNDCLGFLYSKCGGNLNRFLSKEDCMNRCAI